MDKRQTRVETYYIPVADRHHPYAKITEETDITSDGEQSILHVSELLSQADFEAEQQRKSKKAS